MTEVGLDLVPDDDPRLCLPSVTVEVDGVQVEAILDSGAARTQLVGLPDPAPSAGPNEASAGVFGVQMTTGSGEVSLRIPGVPAVRVHATVVPPGLPGHGNLLGQDVLGRFRCTYRLADGRLILDGDPPALTHPIFLSARRHVYLDVTWSDHRATASAVFDTGAAVTVVDERFAERHPELFTPEGSSTGTDATGRSVETPMAIMRGPQILGERFADALVAFVDLSGANSTLERRMDLVLGWTVLSQADWYVDHQGARAACTPRI